jgi:tetratricopeptide (TPR) repeat protein
VVAVGIYLLPIKPLKVKEETKDNKEEQVQEETQAFNSENYFEEKKAALSESQKDSLEILENAGDLEEITAFCYRNKFPFLGAKYEIQQIEESSEESELINSGDRLIRISYLEQRNSGAKLFFGNAAIRGYKKALELNPENTDLKVRLASAYMDGTNQVMNGVALLLEVLEAQPKNIDANLILGRYGIVSGQFEKALNRLTTVIEQDSTIAEAYLYRAEALNGMGKSEAAIADFEKCKTLLDNPELENEIDVFIKELKNK